MCDLTVGDLIPYSMKDEIHTHFLNYANEKFENNSGNKSFDIIKGWDI